jgi:NAD(P)H-hydrate repair Nnr-like enzyme with NAD(P)H-hydrate epimerase domain
VERIEFHTKKSQKLLGVTLEEKKAALAELQDVRGLSDIQIAEMSGTGVAMVSRFALGNSASAGEVLGIVNDSLPGLCALSGLRHLRAAGSRVHLITFGAMESACAVQLLKNLAAMDVPLEHLEPSVLSEPEFQEYFAGLCLAHHCCIQGLFTWPNPDWSKQFVQLMNDQSIPTHCIEFPLGLHPDSGVAVQEAQFASSTLTLGNPFFGARVAAEKLGRCYASDIHITQDLLAQILQIEAQGMPESIFSEQPVVQFFASPS